MDACIPEEWGDEMAAFCHLYKMSPDDFFNLTWPQYWPMRDRMVAEAGRPRDGG